MKKIIIIIILLSFNILHAKTERYNNELSPQEQQCLKDTKHFIYCYGLIEGIYNEFMEKFDSVPDIIKEDFKYATELYYRLKVHTGQRLSVLYLMKHDASALISMNLPLLGWLNLGSSSILPRTTCKEMYNKEINQHVNDKRFKLEPESDETFGDHNWVCTTSYADALKNLIDITNKYESGSHICPKLEAKNHNNL